MANTVYDKKIIESVAKDQLITKVNTRALMTVDTSLAEESGMTKIINVYAYTGAAEALEAGQGNTTRGSVAPTTAEYKVKRVQANFDYTDEDFHADNAVVDHGVAGATNELKNKMNADFAAECGKATLSVPGELSYDTIVDAIAELNIEDESGLFVVIPNEDKALLRKDPDYMAARQGEVVYNGQVGTVCGIPVIALKGFTAPYVMTKDAVRLLLKEDIEAGTERDEDKCINSVYVRAFYVCALVDATKICKIGE
jgi:hypothetical protein